MRRLTAEDLNEAVYLYLSRYDELTPVFRSKSGKIIAILERGSAYYRVGEKHTMVNVAPAADAIEFFQREFALGFQGGELHFKLAGLDTAGPTSDMLKIVGFLAKYVPQNSAAVHLHRVMTSESLTEDFSIYMGQVLHYAGRLNRLIVESNHVNLLCKVAKYKIHFDYVGDWTLLLGQLSEFKVQPNGQFLNVTVPFPVRDLFNGRRGYGFEVSRDGGEYYVPYSMSGLV